jgi:hypothetical protein
MMGAVDASDVILACAYLNTSPPSEDGVWPPAPPPSLLRKPRALKCGG